MNYEKVTVGLDNYKVIKRTNEDGTESWIPIDESNSDYRAYLESLKDAAN